MKLSQNAIKFLLAQYRAVFKHAYLKGLVSATVLTTALSAIGSANVAQAANADFNGLSGSEFEFTGTPLESDAALKGPWQAAATAKVSGGGITNKDSSNGALELSGSGSLTVSMGAATDKFTISPANGAVDISLSTVQVNQGTVSLGAKDSANPARLGASNIILGVTSNGSANGGANGTAAAANAAADTAIIELGKGSILGAKDVLSIDKSNLTIGQGGTLRLIASGSAEKSPAEASLNVGTLTIAGGKIDTFGQDSASGSLNIQLIQGTMTGSSVFNVAGDGDVVNLKFVTDAAPSQKVFNVQSGTLALSGTLNVSGGTLQLAQGTLDSGSAGTLNLQGQSRLVLNSADINANTKLNLTKATATIEFSDGTQVDLGKLSFVDDAANAGQIGVAEKGALVKGQDLLVSQPLGTNSKQVNLEAVSLTLGDASKASADLKFNEAKAKNITFLSSEPSFILQNDVTLQNLASTADAAGAAELAAAAGSASAGDLAAAVGTDGKISGNFTVSGGKTFTVDGGSYTDSYDVGLDNGNLKVINTAAQPNTSSSLALTGKFLLDNTHGNNTVQVSGAKTLLDLSKAQVSLTGHATNTSKIAVESQGKVLLSSDNLEGLLAVTEQSGAGFVLDSGFITVTGDTQLSDTALQKGDDFINSAIVFKNGTGGTVDIQGDLTLSGSTGLLDLGESGVLNTQSLILNNVKDAKTTLAAGTLNVASNLTAKSSDDSIVITEGTLNLGPATKTSQEHENDVYSGAAGGAIGSNLKLDGAGAVNFVTGTWTARDIELTEKASKGLTIGNDGTMLDAAGKPLPTTLTAHKLQVANGANAKVTAQGSATFDELSVASTQSGLVVDGKLMVNGKYTPASDNGGAAGAVAAGAGAEGAAASPASYGVALAANSVLVNQTGTLSFGADATKAIKVSYTSSGSGSVDIDPQAFATDALTVNGGKIAFAFDNATKFNAATLDALKKQLVKDDTLNNGVLSVGNAQITGITDKITSDNTIAWNDLKGYQDILGDYSQEQLSKAVVTGIDVSSAVRGHYGALSSNTITNGTLSLYGNTSLSAAANNSGNYVSGVNGVTLGLDVKDHQNLRLENGGKLDQLDLGTAASVQLSNGENTLKGIQGKSGSQVILSNSTTTVSKDAKAASFTTDAQSKLLVQGNLETLGTKQGEVAQVSSFGGILQVDGTAKFGQRAELAGNQNLFKQGLTAARFLGVYGDTQVQGTAVFDDDAEIARGATFKADRVQLGQTAGGGALKVLKVGSDSGLAADSAVPAAPATPVTNTGYFEVGELALNGGVLMIDPSYQDKTSLAAVTKFTDKGASQLSSLGGYLNGSIVVGQNAALQVGEKASLESLQALLKPYQNAQGALQADQLGAVLALNSQVTLSPQNRIVVDSATPSHKIIDGTTGWFTVDYAKNFSGSSSDSIDLYLGKNSALVVSDNVLKEGAAINFDKEHAEIKGDSGSKIILAGDAFVDRDKVTLFTDKDADGKNGVAVYGDKIRVETLNGLMYFYLEGDNAGVNESLSFDHTKADRAFLDASVPVRDTLLSYAAHTVNYSDYYSGKSEHKISMVGDKANPNLVKVDPQDPSKVVLTEQGQQAQLDTSDFVAMDGTVYHKAHNEFLSSVTRNSTSGVEADQVARMAAFGGAPHAALLAGSTTTEAITSRMGIGVPSSSMTFADNSQGAGMWLSPIYKGHESDKFSAQGLNYGVDMGLFGIALGGDYALGNGFKVGAAFNVGSGDADGYGVASAVSNDFDYYGFALYGGYSMDALSLVADLSYSVVDNTMVANTAVDQVKATTDTALLSLGLTGQYTLNFEGVDVAPHVGLRYSRLTMDDYTLTGSHGTIGRYSTNAMDIFSIPVGVTFSKEFVTGSWLVKPALDLTLTANMGDDSTSGNVAWSGISNMQTNVQNEVLDSFTYGANLGVSAQKDNLSLGLGFSYTGAASADEYGVNASVRFTF